MQTDPLKHVRIRSTGSYTPARIVPNAALVDGLPTSVEWIEQNLGVVERRIAEPDEYTSDLAACAGRAAVACAGLDSRDIDLLIVATATPDRKSPSTACIVQSKIGLRNTCPAFDVSAVCAGFIYSLSIGAHFVELGTYRRVLVIGADTFSKITDWHHRNCVFFGDGAGAVVIEHDPDGGGFFSSLLFADGAGMDGFTVYPGDSTFTMDVKAVYRAATSVLPQAIRDLLCRHQLAVDDVSMIIPHQPSIRVLRHTAEVLGIPFSTVRTNLRHYANTAGATIPLLLDQLNRQGALVPGQMLLFAAVGAGWTWGSALYRWT